MPLLGGLLVVRPLQKDAEMTESPNGSLAVYAEPWEARSSQWVYRPRIVSLNSGKLIWSPSDGMWSLDGATWEADSVVRLTLRKFPGDQRPPFVQATVDCESGAAFVEGTVECSISSLEQQIERVLASRPRA